MAVQKKQLKGKLRESQGNFLSSEKGTIIKKWGSKIPVCIVFPNSYYVGMSNLATHMLYKRLNSMDDVVCERCFLTENGKPLSLESGRPLSSFEIVFFTLSFELDYINIPNILHASSVHALAGERTEKEPIIVAGGICVMSNPEPIYSFFDLFIMGDIETTMGQFMETYREALGAKREVVIEKLSAFQWVYNPQEPHVSYNDDGTLKSVMPPDFNVKTSRHNKKELATSAIITDKTEFSDMFLIEGTRGCPSRCPFCLLGNMYDFICEKISPSVTELTDIGILGGGVSFYPGLVEMVKTLKEQGKNIHLPSMRVDEIPIELISLMKDEVKTLTFGIEAATERLRRFIGKPFTNEEIYEKLDAILGIKPFNLKLYFMIGLYNESQKDIEDIAELTKKIKHIMIKRGAQKGFVGSITVHASPFVPKPFTPFQWLPMDNLDNLKKKINWLKSAIGKIDNTYFTHESVKFSFLQGAFARGDRKVNDTILRFAAGANFSKVINESPVNLNFYTLRERNKTELFPWDFITGNIDKDKLWKRLQTALTHLG
ncbi:MAG: hypothetical protein C0399_01835 [Syntrophus sp. (in: bacteria)]|nr:hypothetical protein [Syntrophus sp. (in: bacteria)]